MRASVAGLVIAPWLIGGAMADAPKNDMANVRAGGHWSGCVYQQGFAPYPIKISPRPAPTLKVEYPGLCAGYHTPRQKGWPNEAVEVITKDADVCIETVDLNYSFEKGMLRIDYQIEGGAYALLVPAEKDAGPHNCEPSEATS